LVGLVDL